jgi:integrase
VGEFARFSVRKIRHPGGRVSHWIVDANSEVHRRSLDVLKRYGPGTQATYAYGLADHLNWAAANGKTPDRVTLDDLLRYMNGLTGAAEDVYGIAWRRADQLPLGPSAANNVATIVKAYYLCVAAKSPQAVHPTLIEGLGATSATVRGRRTAANPLSPRKPARRPRYLSDQVVAALYEPGVLLTARDVMIVTWLHDGGFRVGGLCGLRFSDLHLKRHHPCGQRADPHVHLVSRDDNPNGARAKSRFVSGARLSADGHVVDGVIRAVSPDMVSTFYAYLLDEYHPVQYAVTHEQVLIHTQGTTVGAALTTAGIRKMLRRACGRAAIDVRVTPHSFRHKAAAAFYVASDFNADMVAQEFGWASPEMVTDLYGKSANRHAITFLKQAWEATARPPVDAHLKESGDEW